MKKIILILLIIVVLSVGGFFFFRSKKTTSSHTIPPINEKEEEKDWGNISGWFLDDPDLKKLWKGHNFTYNQTNDWINIGLSPTDAVFAFWLQNKKKLTPVEVLNHGNEKSLREEWINEEDNTKGSEKKWFGENQPLNEAEVNWVCGKIKKNDKFKILPAEKFYSTDIAFKEENKVPFFDLLINIENKEKELVFIPVKNENSHWSLLIYERVTGLFYHYDINEGVNFEYSAPLLIELLTKMKPSSKSDIDEQWWETFVKTRLSQKRADDSNSGIAVINVIQRIIQLYNSRFRITAETIDKNGEKYTMSKHNLELVEKSLGEFNFSEERKIWQERYRNEIGHD